MVSSWSEQVESLVEQQFDWPLAVHLCRPRSGGGMELEPSGRDKAFIDSLMEHGLQSAADIARSVGTPVPSTARRGSSEDMARRIAEGLDQTMNGGENCVNLALVHKYPVNADEPPPLDQRVFSVISVNANKDGSIVYAAEAGGSSDQADEQRQRLGSGASAYGAMGSSGAAGIDIDDPWEGDGNDAGVEAEPEEHGMSPGRAPYAVARARTLGEAEARVTMAAGGFFVEASCALLDIAEQHLFEAEGYKSFRAYILERKSLGFGYRQARAWVAAARFIRSLPPSMPVPQYERLVRPLTRCEPGVARLAWERVLRYHNEEGRRMTAELVVSCIQEVGTASTVAQSDSEDESGMADVVAPVTAVSRANGHDEDAVPAGSRPIFLQSASVEWYTPQCILDKVAEMFGPGGIDLDPCSSEAANTRVKAGRFFDVALDGLSEACRWEGNVFVNPPFGSRGVLSMQNLFFERCVKEYRQGAVKQAVVLLKAAVGYKWFRAVLEWPVCFLWERLAFVQPQHTSVGEESELKWGSRVQNPHGSVVVYLGTNVDKFVRIFGDIGSIAGANAWAHQNSPR
ncbi:hypothetical protein VOLCADRAFT_108225 [Volvox carteri f. nagariensis]|uniref:Uncharacterized protein n=1 Tax=Volvox carteri f. nagariensis TaxID=3068 RepID=D8UIZ6_VOLCA|nr:uncharacterized protein VOLCADRAFT_108225 [Volvox carteri f. nagariensis]EFJ40307.1 hypothetical protein VOLCADRAFT_108225 [Volvox carteri f. nagariensis]|eukprot:XP_002958641.1 hypothetical protein VOLCADRAFT_108225 [Volvox carteri f. nagariensis]